MIGTSALDQALEAYYRPRNVSRQIRTDDAIALLEWGVFSIRQVQAITGLPQDYVRSLATKRDHTGGNLNPDTLPLLRELRDGWRRGERLIGVAQRIFDGGTKQAMTNALTGVPMTTLYRWMRRA